MAATKEKMRTYHLSYHLDLEVTVVVEAVSIENAIIKGRELQQKVPTIVEQINDYNDYSAELTGAYTVD